MADMIIIDAEVNEDGKLVVQLPADAPRGQVRVIVERLPSFSQDELTEEALDSEFEELINDPSTFSGLGLTMGEILQSPAIGVWEDREDMADAAQYVEDMRRKSRERRLKRD